MLRGTPSLFPKEAIVVEILETIEPTSEVIEACRLFKKNGYQLALDDFTFTESYLELLPLIDIVKIDFRQTSAAGMSELLIRLLPYGCRLLAEKIETYDEFNRALDMGFAYFQGYFFAKPEILRNKDIPQNKLSMLQLISEVNSAEFDTKNLEKLISREVAVSYKLLTYLNSAHFARLSPLKSIRQAVAFLGERGVKLFVSLIATSRLATDKPDELVRLSIIRARLLEQIGEHVGADSGELFMLGLFSLIDAMLDNPMEKLVNRLPLSKDIRQALTKRDGPLAVFLNFAESFERADWATVSRLQEQFVIEETTVIAMQLDAIAWADCFDSTS